MNEYPGQGEQCKVRELSGGYVVIYHSSIKTEHPNSPRMSKIQPFVADYGMDWVQVAEENKQTVIDILEGRS